MKKKFVVILGIQSLVILILLTYAFVQQGIAQEKSVEAQRNAGIAQENAMRANEEVKKAQDRVQELRAELMKCKK